MRWLNALWLEWKIALAFLLDNRLQTLLIMVGIAVGSAVIVFITALISGLQSNVIERTLGTQAHLKIEMPDEVNRVLPASDNAVALVLHSPRAQRLRSLSNWQALRDLLDGQPGVRAVSPLATGPAIARRGQARASIALMGIDPERYQRIVPVARDLVAGRFVAEGDQVALGAELARELGLSVGDKLRLDGGEGRERVVRVAGIFELGVRELDARYVYLDLRQAQILLDLPGGVTQIDLTVEDIFAAEKVAERMARLTGMQAESWMATNGHQWPAAQCLAFPEHDHRDDPHICRAFRGLRYRQRAGGQCCPAHPGDRHPSRHGQPAQPGDARVSAARRAARAGRFGPWRTGGLGVDPGVQSVRAEAVRDRGLVGPAAVGHAGGHADRRAGRRRARPSRGPLRSGSGDPLCLTFMKCCA